MSELPKEWAELDDEEIIEKLNTEDVDMDVIEILAESDNSEISEAAEEAYANMESKKRNKQKPTEWQSLTRNEIINKIKNENIESSIFNFLAESSNDKKILEEISIHENIPESDLNKIIERNIISKNKILAYKLMPKGFWNNKEEDILNLIKKDEINEKALEYLFKFLEEWGGDKNDFFSIKIDRTLLQKAIALSPNVSEEILIQISNDLNLDTGVQKAAKKTLLKRQPNKKESLETSFKLISKGLGIDISAFAINKTEASKLKKKLDDDEFEGNPEIFCKGADQSEELGLLTGAGAVLLCKKTNHEKDWEDIVIDMEDEPEKSKEIRTPFKGSSWIIRVENNKGVWQTQDFEGKFDSSLLSYEIKGICVDPDDIYWIVNFFYNGEEITLDQSLSGTSIDYYLLQPDATSTWFG